MAKYIEVITYVINADLDELGIDQEHTPVLTLVNIDYIISVRKEEDGFGHLAALDMSNGNQYATGNTYQEIIEKLKTPIIYG